MQTQKSKIMSSESKIMKADDQSIGIEKIRKYLDALNLTTNLTKGEVDQFIEISQAYGLNPFKREIYASKYGSNFSIIVGFETYIKRAERSGRLSGWHVTTSGSLDDQNPGRSQLKATITIHRKDWEHPFIHDVFFNEYAQRKGDGTLNKFWKEKPITMIKKVAMAQGFRLCFSDELGGLPYTSEEIGAMEAIEIPSSAIIEAPAPAKAEKAKDQEAPAKKKKSKPEEIKIEANQEPKDEAKEMEAEFTAIKIQIDLAQSIEDLKIVYDSFPSWQKDGEFLGRLSMKRKEIESIEEEMKRKALESPSIEEAMNQEAGSAQSELF